LPNVERTYGILEIIQVGTFLIRSQFDDLKVNLTD